MTLITEANFSENMGLGLYSPLAGVSKPMLVPVKNVAVAGQTQIQTLTFSASLVTGDKVTGKVGGVAITKVEYGISKAATLTAIAEQIAAKGTNVTAVSDGTDTITVTTALGKNDEDLTEFAVDNTGAGTATASTAETQASIKNRSSLNAGLGVVISAGVASAATDNATHIIVGSNLSLVDGTNEFKAVEELLGTMVAVEKGLARVQCEVKAGETIVKGDNVAFQGGVLVKKVAQTQYFAVEEINGLIAQISFK